MADLLVVFGPPAVGKMAVGNEVAKIAGFKLFHNHISIEMLIRFFPYGTPEFNTLNREFRTRIFEEMAKSDQKGLVFTYVFALDDENDWVYIERLVDIFRKENSKLFFVELEASQKIRLERNSTEYRLSEKPSKRDLEFSSNNLKRTDSKYRLNTNIDDMRRLKQIYNNFMKINNEELEAQEVAEKIVAHFKLLY